MAQVSQAANGALLPFNEHCKRLLRKWRRLPWPAFEKATVSIGKNKRKQK
jgi:hypothetical protein